MFDISWSEIFIVAVVAIIFVGPKELPGMLRTFGRLIGQLRRTATDFQRTFNEALREAEKQANVDKMRSDLDTMRAAADPTKDLRKNLDDVKRAMSGNPLRSAAPTGAAPAAAPTEGVFSGPAPSVDIETAPAPVPPPALSNPAPVATPSIAPPELAELPRAAGDRR